MLRPVPRGVYPANDFDAYRSSAKRAPRAAPIAIPQTLSELSGPHYGAATLAPGASDLTRPIAGGTAQGQRIIVHGRVTDEWEVAEYRDMLVIIRDRVQALIKSGANLQQVRAARPTFDYDVRYGATGGAWTTDNFVEAVYASLKNPPRTGSVR